MTTEPRETKSTVQRSSTRTADEAYEQLRQAIHSGELMPNERLIEVELAARLQVSRAVVRTVLVRLGQDGLVVLTPNRGAHVRLVTEAEAVEILQVRAVLEALTARQAAVNATAREIAGLRRVLNRMTQKLEQDDLLGYSEGNASLHKAIIAAARHETAARLISGLRAQLVRFQYRTILVPGRPAQSLGEHTDIVAAIAARDPDAAEAAMRRHLGHVELTLSSTARARSGPSTVLRPS
ncbi:GntR family transcriptional regulator [Plantactinospora sonchi]|uniref:GntR family transcriptional regulator n=1 Tax=Plantactinospora sonchi TaxID=1544735 RepID=A0ABU7RNX6_9ACTN